MSLAWPDGPITTDNEYMAKVAHDRLMGGHWGGKPGWLTGEERDERGMPVRIWFRPCPVDCPCGGGLTPEQARAEVEAMRPNVEAER